MTAGPAWACPECGLVRSVDVWRRAVSLELPRLTCAMVPLGGALELVRRTVVVRARCLARGEPLDGCGLLVCTWADGRRVWAAEAEELAELLEGATLAPGPKMTPDEVRGQLARAREALAAANQLYDEADSLAEDDPRAEDAGWAADEALALALAEYDRALAAQLETQAEELAELERDARALRGGRA